MLMKSIQQLKPDMTSRLSCTLAALFSWYMDGSSAALPAAHLVAPMSSARALATSRTAFIRTTWGDRARRQHGTTVRVKVYRQQPRGEDLTPRLLSLPPSHDTSDLTVEIEANTRGGRGDTMCIRWKCNYTRDLTLAVQKDSTYSALMTKKMQSDMTVIA